MARDISQTALNTSTMAGTLQNSDLSSATSKNASTIESELQRSNSATVVSKKENAPCINTDDTFCSWCHHQYDETVNCPNCKKPKQSLL